MSPIPLLTLLLLPRVANAAPSGWLLDGAAQVVGAPMDVPLYRGRQGEGRPMVVATIEDQQVLAALDLVGEPTRIGVDLARAAGIDVREPKSKDEDQVVEIPEIRIPNGKDGELVLAKVRARVVRGDALTLGLSTFEELAIGILPSKGKVMFLPVTQGGNLIAEIGTPIPIKRQDFGRWDEGGSSRTGNGLTASVPGRLSAPERKDIRIILRTDEVRSTVEPGVAAVVDLKDGVDRAQTLFGIGRADLPPALSLVVRAVPDPDPTVVASLGYDVLSSVDLVLSGDLLAVRPAMKPFWQDTATIQAADARARYVVWAQKNPELAKPPTGPELGGPPLATPAGDPGRPADVAFHRGLAEGLWEAGATDEALQRSLDAARAAGDSCAPYLELGERRLRASGPSVSDEQVARSIREPLERAGALWDTWMALPDGVREDILQGRPAPSGSLQIAQDDACRRAWGLLMGAWLAVGSLDEVSALFAAHKQVDPSVGQLMGLALLEADPGYAESLVREAQGLAEGPVELGLALASARVASGQTADVGWLQSLPYRRSDHPLTLALIAADLGAPPPTLAHPLPGLLAAHVAHAVRGGQVPVEAVEAALTAAALREPWSHQVKAVRAVWDHLRGLDTALPNGHDHLADIWAARAVLASMSGDKSARDKALAELRLRFPELPIGSLGLDDAGLSKAGRLKSSPR